MHILEPLRWITGRGVLLYEQLTKGSPISRPADEQATIDQQVSNLKLYEFNACPFCMMVRKIIHKKALPIERRDARRNEQWRQELQAQGGKLQTPCLQITDERGNQRWMYESKDIINYLNERFPTET